MPEIGATAQVCVSSDGTPFLLGFTGAFEREDGDASFRGGRPRAKLGDIILRGRDGNRVYLHRGGVLEVGSETLPRSFYIPLQGLIRHVGVRHESLYAGGSVNWDVQRSDEADEEGPDAVLTLLAFSKATEEKATVRLRLGRLDGGDDRVEFLVAPTALDKTGAPSASVFSFLVDKDGAAECAIADNLTLTVEGELSFSGEGAATLSFASDCDVSVGGDSTFDVSGRATFSAQDFVARAASVLLDSSNVQLGGEGGSKVVVASPMFEAFLSHTHSVTGTATGPPTVVPLSLAMTAQNVRAR
jgi:hypothetical protein